MDFSTRETLMREARSQELFLANADSEGQVRVTSEGPVAQLDLTQGDHKEHKENLQPVRKDGFLKGR